MRIAIFAPHFAEYSTRLATALRPNADVLLVNEAANLASECEGLVFAARHGDVARATFNGRVATGGRSPRRFFAFRRLCRAIEAFHPDILHIQEQGDDFTAALAEHFAQTCAVVLTVHDPAPHSGSDTLVAQRFAAGLARLRAAAAAYHVHGTYCERVLRDRLRTAKPVAATPHGVILVPARGMRREPEARFLFFGRMEAYKGLDTLLDAIDLLAPGTGVLFVLAGRGPEIERWRGLIEANAAIEAIDTYLPPVQAIEQFQRARAVIVPYRDATQSGVISAAFGNGRPVIASRVGGLVESVADGVDGILIDPDDPQALAAAITRLSEAGPYETLKAGAGAAAGGRFAWEGVAQRLLALYEQLLTSGRLA